MYMYMYVQYRAIQIQANTIMLSLTALQRYQVWVHFSGRFGWKKTVSLVFNPFTSGIIIFFPDRRTGLFSVKIRKDF